MTKMTLYVASKDPAADVIIGASALGCVTKDVRVTVHDGDGGGVSLLSYWSGGSRDYHAVVDLANMHAHYVPENGSGFSAADKAFGPAGMPLNLPAPGFAVVTRTKGHRESMRIAIHESDATKLLPKPGPELSWAERVVLVATSSLKSSYGGISDYRRHAAMRETDITDAEYTTAKAMLIANGLLNKAGAITNAGRNACPQSQLWGMRKERAAA